MCKVNLLKQNQYHDETISGEIYLHAEPTLPLKVFQERIKKNSLKMAEIESPRNKDSEPENFKLKNIPKFIWSNVTVEPLLLLYALGFSSGQNISQLFYQSKICEVGEYSGNTRFRLSFKVFLSIT